MSESPEMNTLNISNSINTPNAILHSFGYAVFQKAQAILNNGNILILDFHGLKNVTSAFLHASVGNLVTFLGNTYEKRVHIQGISDPIWQEKINEAIELAKNPDYITEHEQAIALLFED